jgi:hypothetical protein
MAQTRRSGRTKRKRRAAGRARKAAQLRTGKAARDVSSSSRRARRPSLTGVGALPRGPCEIFFAGSHLAVTLMVYTNSNAGIP